MMIYLLNSDDLNYNRNKGSYLTTINYLSHLSYCYYMLIAIPCSLLFQQIFEKIFLRPSMRKVASVQRMAKRFLRCGANKLWIDPKEKERVAAVQTYEHVKKLVEDNIIIRRRDKVNSKAHARKLERGRAIGRRMGLGKRKGTKEARLSSKTIWMRNIRSMRETLKELKKKGELVGEEYRMYYVQAKGNLFKNKNVMLDAISKRKTEMARFKELGLQAEALKMSRPN